MRYDMCDYNLNMCSWSVLCIFLFLQFYSNNKGTIATTLLKPKRKQGAKSAEVALSKSKSHKTSPMAFLIIYTYIRKTIHYIHKYI